MQADNSSSVFSEINLTLIQGFPTWTTGRRVGCNSTLFQLSSWSPPIFQLPRLRNPALDTHTHTVRALQGMSREHLPSTVGPRDFTQPSNERRVAFLWLLALCPPCVQVQNLMAGPNRFSPSGEARIPGFSSLTWRRDFIQSALQLSTGSAGTLLSFKAVKQMSSTPSR